MESSTLRQYLNKEADAANDKIDTESGKNKTNQTHPDRMRKADKNRDD